ncbi:GNAT family N-acetyltransferase [Streptomyces sp. NPDC050560]|uniref:GNAT family N-acetyltransferase n=1 Tax=Streptomyces sp. NPDC050560 TaxID=3365630 RepID=UPI00379FF296
MSGDYTVRQVRADDWPAVKALRLAALRDPVAPIAFFETYDEAVARPDAFWKERTLGGAEGGRNRQFVAEAPDGEWLGTVTALLEQAGTVDFMGEAVDRPQAHLVGVFVRPGHRGGTVSAALFRTALAWTAPRASRTRLLVHRDNGRAEAFYRKLGFIRVRELTEEYEMVHQG